MIVAPTGTWIGPRSAFRFDMSDPESRCGTLAAKRGRLASGLRSAGERQRDGRYYRPDRDHPEDLLDRLALAGASAGDDLDQRGDHCDPEPGHSDHDRERDAGGLAGAVG